MEMSKQLSYSINYKLTIKIIALILVLGMVINLTIPTPQAHAEAVTVTIAVIGSILALVAASYGLTVTYGAVDAAVKDFWTAEAKDFISRSPDWTLAMISQMGILWLRDRLSDPSLLMDALTIDFCNDFFYDWCNTKHNIQEGVSTPIVVANSLNGVNVYLGNYTPVTSTDFYTALAANPFPYYEVPYTDNEVQVFFQNSKFNVVYNNYSIFSIGQNASDVIYYFNITKNGNYYYLNWFKNYNNTGSYYWYQSLFQAVVSYLDQFEASIPDAYTDQTVPQVDYGTALTYTGAPDTTYEDFLETGIEEILLDTYDPTLTEDIPWDEPVPTPATDTTWEDGALGFWQAVGGAISGGLSTAGQSVRQWIDSMHAQMVQYWDALLEWCDGIVEAIEGAEDGFIRGIINEITSVFASAKSTIRSALGIWHYVVDWLRSIAAPFNLFLGLAGRISPYITLPVYASIAGLVILGVYKKFIG